jgi:hypothetical protein
MKNYHQSTGGGAEILYADKSLRDKQLLIVPFIRTKNMNVEGDKVKIHILVLW